MKILVTGANGLLGRYLLSSLSDSHTVFGIVRSAVTDEIPGATYIPMDLSRPLEISELPRRIDVVVHLAQSSRFREFPEGVPDTFGVNVRATLDLLEYCRVADGKQFFLASTGGVYEGTSQPISEGASLIPPSDIGFYFASKLSSEMLSASFRSVFEVCILRLFFMYGPRQRSDMFLPRLINNIIQEKPIIVRPDGGIFLNPILVDDVALLLTRMLGRKIPPVVNIGGKDIVSIHQITGRLGELLAKQPIFSKDGRGEDVVADITTMSQFLHPEDLTPFDSGLRVLVDSVKERL